MPKPSGNVLFELSFLPHQGPAAGFAFSGLFHFKQFNHLGGQGYAKPAVFLGALIATPRRKRNALSVKWKVALNMK